MANEKTATPEETQEVVATPDETLEETATPKGTQEELTTTEKLFPETMETDGEDPPVKVEEVETEVVAAESKETEKIQVDGIGEVSMEDLVKNYKSSTELGRERNNLGDMKKELEVLKEDMQKSLLNNKPQEVDTLDTLEDEYVDPVIAKLTKEVSSLTELVNGVNESTADVQYEASIKQLDKHLKDNGHEDFLDYKERVEAKVKDLIKDLPETQKPSYWNMDYFSSVFKDLKLHELMLGKQEKKEEPKIDERPAAKVIPIIESSGGKGSDVDSSSSAYQAAHKKAMSSGRTEDWQECMKLKGVVGY